MALRFLLPGTVTDTTLPYDYLDPIITPGTLYVGRGGDTYSWASQANPINGALLKNLDDIANAGNDATWMVQSGSTVAFASKQFDFTGLTANKNSLLLPASLATALWGGSGSQYFLACLYLTLPTSANWWNATSDRPFLTWAGANGTGNGNYTTEADIFCMSQATNTSVPNLWVRRQTVIGTTANLNVAPDSTHFGNLVQIGYWRNASGTGLRIKGASATVSTTGAVGAANTSSFSAKQGQLGIGSSLWPTSSLPAAIGWKLKGCWFEDLSVSGRDPVTTLDSDYAFGVA